MAPKNPPANTPSNERLTAAIIVISDRAYSGERPDAAGPAAAQLFESHNVDVRESVVIPENKEAITNALTSAQEQGHDIILTAGGTGLKPNNVTPEVTRPFIDTELPALAMHIFCEGVKNSSRAGLTRGLVGVTSRDETAALIINAPGSVGGVTDTITVIGPLLPSIFEQLGKHI